MKPITEYTNYTEVTKTKKKNVTIRVLEFHKQGFYQKQIARKLNLSPRVVFYHTKKLLELGYLEEKARSNIVIYRVTEKGKRAIKTQRVTKILTTGETPKITLHNLPVKIPILKDTEIPDCEINEGLKNVKRQFKKLPFLGMTITRIEGSSIMLNIHKRDIDDPSEEFNIVLQAVILANDYLKNIGFELDITNIKVNGRHMSIPDPVAKREVQRKRYTEVGLGRTANKITPNDSDIQAKAWIDGSEGRPEFESNDRECIDNYLRLPDNIAGINNSMAQLAEANEIYAENIKLHMKWVKTGINVQNKLISLLEQKSLRGFLDGA